MERIKNYITRIKYRNNPIAYARFLGVKIGEGTKLLCKVPETFGSEPWLISLGKNVEVTSGVRFITHDGAV